MTILSFNASSGNCVVGVVCVRYLDFLSKSLRGELHTPRMHAAVNEALDFPSAWPALALTMVPKVDLDTLRWMVEDVVSW